MAELPGSQSKGWGQVPRIQLESRRLDLGLDKRARAVYLRPKGELRGLLGSEVRGRAKKRGQGQHLRSGAELGERGQARERDLRRPTQWGPSALGSGSSGCLQGRQEASSSVSKGLCSREQPWPPPPPKTPLGSQNVPSEPLLHSPAYSFPPYPLQNPSSSFSPHASSPFHPPIPGPGLSFLPSPALFARMRSQKLLGEVRLCRLHLLD